MYSPKLILSVLTALLIPVYAQIPAGCSEFDGGGGELAQNQCPSGQKFCGGAPGGGLAYICCPNSVSC
ncbi:hypothetical protein CGRA01v4_05938 [Colletotrichum graminicola]|uniref:Uncharacterized protein n=1 Tax=Colletotrichum graminicola (strain M1.001 / M2 / FGSC 10212) TaxID=645133 RepID=E3QNL9_COLGM|nr:uncharacterized protein GLRG_07776 [Colletotrichum graminicola M1.001]EFQ32506.1 hypothetical protein GLRG_07776 [Colletotrichum graminicola M1.001]WDK14657.1 hypothetical protein CGRA01v4_05938 [Colletotrichum graminicola]